MNMGQPSHVGIDKWPLSLYAQQYFDLERDYISAALRQSVGPTVLQLGQRLPAAVVDDFDLPLLVKTNYVEDKHADVVVDPAFLPFSPEVFSTVVLPHVLESHSLPHQVLREVHRVMMPEGHIILTGFNPASLIGLQRWLRPAAVCRGRYYSMRRVIDWLQLLGFDMVRSSIFHYAPLSRSARVKNAFQFLESVGNRWLPMSGGGYMISAKKRDAGQVMVGRMRFNKSKRKLATTAVVRSPINSENRPD